MTTLQPETSAVRLYAIYEKLLASVLNDDGFGGPVAHIAEVDGWQLRIATSDFGELMASARKGKRVIGFEEVGATYDSGKAGVQWEPIYRGTTPDDLDTLADLADQAEWTDTIQRRAA